VKPSRTIIESIAEQLEEDEKRRFRIGRLGRRLFEMKVERLRQAFGVKLVDEALELYAQRQDAEDRRQREEYRRWRDMAITRGDLKPGDPDYDRDFYEDLDDVDRVH
jgi:hypothetical protein